MRRLITKRLIPALTAAGLAGAIAGPALADGAGDPLAGLAALEQGDLATLSGRQGFSLSDQELAAISHGGKFDAGGDIKSGAVDLGSAMQRMNGINNQAINTGNDANVLSGLAVHIHLY